MATIIRQATSLTNNLMIEIYDKSQKNCEYNYLVEVSMNGRSTKASQFFKDKDEADKYYSEILSKGEFLESKI